MALPTLQQTIVNPRVVKPRDYTLAGNVINTLNERHTNTLQQRSAIAVDLAKNYDLHDSEDEFKTNFTNEMLGRIDANIDAYSGYAGNALSETIRVAGDYASDPRLLGRLRANNEYKAFIEGLNKANISDRQRQYLIEKNPYYYSDKYKGETDSDAIQNRQIEAESGIVRQDKIVGGTKWSPGVNAVTEVDLNAFMNSVIANLGKEYGASGTTPYFLGSDGKYTTDMNKSVDGMFYYTKTGGGYEKLSKEKIEEAVKNAFEANKNAEEWLYRQWELDKWDNQKGNTEGNLGVNNMGTPLSYDDYKSKIIKTYAKDHAYYKPGDTRIDASVGMTALASAAKEAAKEAAKAASKGSGNGSDDPTKYHNIEYSGGHIKMAVENTTGKIARQQNAFNSLVQFATEQGLKVGSSDSIDVIYDKLSNKYASQNLPLPAQIINGYKEYKLIAQQLEEDYANNIDKKNAMEFKAAIDNGTDITVLKNSKNPYAIRYCDNVSKTFTDPEGNPLDKVYFRVSDANQALLACGSNPEGKGISTFEDSYGHQYISLDKEHQNYLYLVNQIVQNFKAPELGNYYSRGNIHFWGTEWKDEEGNMHESRNKNWTNSFVNDIEDEYKRATKWIEKDKEENLKEPINYVEAPLWLKPETSFYEIADEIEGSKTTVITADQKHALNAFAGFSPAECEMQFGDNTSNSHWIVPVEKRANVIDVINGILSDSSERSRVTFHTDPYGLGTEVVVAKANYSKAHSASGVPYYEVGDKQTGTRTLTAADSFRVYLPNHMLDEVREQLEKDPLFNAKREMYNDAIGGHNTFLFNGDFYITRNNSNPRTPVFTYNNKSNGASIQLNENQAAGYKVLSDFISEANTGLWSTQFGSKEEAANFVNNAIVQAGVTYAKIYGLPTTNADGDFTDEEWPLANQLEFEKYIELLQKKVR